MTAALKILLIDDSPDDREAIARMLRKVPADFDISEAECGDSGLSRLRGTDFDCVLLDFSLPKDDGLSILREIVLRFPETAIVMMTGLGNERVAVEALKSGAQDYIQKSALSSETLAKAIEGAMQAKQQEAEIIRRANYDELTGLANRRLFDERLEHAMARSGQSTVLAVILFDLNDFKPVNDTHGHGVGDQVLKQVAERSRRVLRGGDTVARMGGDEFVVLLENLPDDGAAVTTTVERRLAESICGAPYEIEGTRVEIGLSIGSALYPAIAKSCAELLRLADEKMYRMKRGDGPDLRRIDGGRR